MDNIGSDPQNSNQLAGTPAQNINMPGISPVENLVPQPVNSVPAANQVMPNNNPVAVNPAPATPPQNVSVAGMHDLLDALYKKGIIQEPNYSTLKIETNGPVSAEQVLLQKGLVSNLDIVKTFAEMRNIGYIDLSNVSIPAEVLNLIPKETARSKMAVAFEQVSNGKIKVAMRDPLDLQTVQLLESVAKGRIEPYYALPEQINDVIDTRYGAQIGSSVDQALEEFGGGVGASTAIGLTADTTGESIGGDAPIIRIVNMILDYGVKNKASDIHIEPRAEKVSVRFRINGFLSEKLTVPTKLLGSVVTRIKILSNLKIDEHRIPQDGRFQVKDSEGSVDIRVSIMPGIYGEKVVMRILTKSKGVLDLEETGIHGISYQRLNEALSKTQGVILVTGPTGSGKTQTLASSLKILNKPNVNVITLEDPVEVRVEGVNQTQVNSEVGLTFANGLRAILRQDPDIIMVGEIRDGETAGLAIQAALVGRLVLSTLHTNSAAGAFVRLIDMGIEPFLLTSTVNLIMAQRLLRRLGEDKSAYKASQKELTILHESLDSLGPIVIKDKEGKELFTFDKTTQEVTLYKPVPSPRNNNTGFEGRTAIFEALKVSEAISTLVVERASISKVEELAIKEGMTTMAQDGFIKVLQGDTTIEEVLRVQNN